MATAVEDLSESQIDALLREAEERLAAKHSGAELAAYGKPFQVAQPSSAVKAAADGAGPVSGPALNAHKAAMTQANDKLAIRVPHLPIKKQDKKNPADAGADWFGLPKTIVTPEAKRDFQVLRMRGVIDSKHHFRKDTRKDLIPKFSVFGTIVEGSMEGEKARLTRKERKRTIAEEVLASQDAKESFKKRYNKIQEKKTSGKKGFYKNLVNQRRKRR